MKRVVVLTLMAVAGCQSAPRPDQFEPQHYTPYPLTAAGTLAIQKGVTEALKHPDSGATFADVRASISSSGIVMACGFANAKARPNERPRRIIYQGILETASLGGHSFTVTGFGGSRLQDDAIVSLCRDHGIVPG